METYVEVRVPEQFTEYEKVRVNGHDFEFSLIRSQGQKEFYGILVGPLPRYLEKEHKKPGLLGRGATREVAREASIARLGQLFPAWPADKLDAWKQAEAARLEELRKAEEAKKAARQKAMDPKAKGASEEGGGEEG